MHQLRQCSGHTNPGKYTQSKVPKCQCSSPAPSRPRAEIPLSKSDEKSIKGHSDYGDHRTVSHPIENRDGVVILFIAAEMSRSLGIESGPPKRGGKER